MERMISLLVSRYESGSVSRRELIQTVAHFTTAQAQPAAEVLTVASINHVSVQVSNLQRSADFYKRVFGLLDDRSDAETARLASGRCHVSLRLGNPVGVIDHFAFGVNQYDQTALTAELKRRGAVPREEGQFGFHVTDPDGVRVHGELQILEHFLDRDLDTIVRCATSPFFFCICWRRSPDWPVPVAPVPWSPNPSSSSTNC